VHRTQVAGVVGVEDGQEPEALVLPALDLSGGGLNELGRIGGLEETPLAVLSCGQLFLEQLERWPTRVEQFGVDVARASAVPQQGDDGRNLAQAGVVPDGS
jgi:hypothetical protein